MQTFLPYPEFAESARVLDQLRLGKQRAEAMQVLRALTGTGYGWRHHLAAKMWAGYEEALVRYGLDVCREWVSAGRTDTCAASLREDFAHATGRCEVRTQEALAAAGELPPWLGESAFHRSHQSALLRKDPDRYGRWFDVSPDLPYTWPASDRARRIPA